MEKHQGYRDSKHRKKNAPECLFSTEIIQAYQAKVWLKNGIQGIQSIPVLIYTRQENYKTTRELTASFPPCMYGGGSLYANGIESLTRDTMDYIYTFRDGAIGAILFGYKGECFPDVWNVHLICSVIPGDAALLLGAYCYALKSQSTSNIGLLEVAGDYTNLKAYCSYSKFGFKETYYRRDWPNPGGKFACNAFSNRLSMFTDLSQFSLDDIVTIAATNKGTNKNALCLAAADLNRQKKLIKIKTYRLKLNQPAEFYNYTGSLFNTEQRQAIIDCILSHYNGRIEGSRQALWVLNEEPIKTLSSIRRYKFNLHVDEILNDFTVNPIPICPGIFFQSSPEVKDGRTWITLTGNGIFINTVDLNLWEKDIILYPGEVLRAWYTDDGIPFYFRVKDPKINLPTDIDAASLVGHDLYRFF